MFVLFLVFEIHYFRIWKDFRNRKAKLQNFCGMSLAPVTHKILVSLP